MAHSFAESGFLGVSTKANEKAAGVIKYKSDMNKTIFLILII